MNIRQLAVASLVPVLVGASALTTVTARARQAAAPQKPIVWPAINSQIGGAYPIDELEHTLTYTLESVAVASRFASADKNVVAAVGKRLLILTSSVTNIQTFDYPLANEAVTFNVFAGNGDRSLSGVDSFILPGLASYPITLKPKGTLRFVTVVQIHGQGPIKRLAVVKGSRGTRRAWYDVQGNLGTMTSVFADGAELRDRAETKAGQAFDLGAFDMVVESAGPVASAGTYQSSASTQVYAVTVKVTNPLRAMEKFGWQYASPTLVDLTGKELSWNRDVIDSATGKSVVAELTAGQPYLLQYAFTAERGRTLKSFTLAMNGGRTIVVDLR